jgi:sugar phosphate isomerase/epimerase
MLDIAIVTDEISLDIRTAIAEGLKLGIRKYELRCIGSYEKRVPYIDAVDYQYLRDRVRDGAIQITALSPGTFKGMPTDAAAIDQAFQHTLPETFAMAQELQAPTVISFSFLRDSSPEIRVIELYRTLAELAEKSGLTVAIENEPGFFCDSGQNTAQLLQQAERKNLAANWDPANAIGTGELPYPMGYDRLKPFIRNVHVKDAVRDSRHGCKLLGEGGVNWFGQLAALQRDAVVPHVTLETHYTPLLKSSQICHYRLKALLKAAEEGWDL